MKIVLKVSIEIVSIEHHVADEVEADSSTTVQTDLTAFKQPEIMTDENIESFRGMSKLGPSGQRSDSGKHHRCSRCGTLGRRRLNGREGCHDCDGWKTETIGKVVQWRTNLNEGRAHDDNGEDI